MTHFQLVFQVVVEEIKVKTAELGKVQQSGHDLMKAISGNIYIKDITMYQYRSQY